MFVVISASSTCTLYCSDTINTTEKCRLLSFFLLKFDDRVTFKFILNLNNSYLFEMLLWRTGFYSVNRTHKYCVTFFSSFYLSFIYRIKQQNNISRPPWYPYDLPDHVLHALLLWPRETATARWPPTSRGQMQPTITTSHKVTLS